MVTTLDFRFDANDAAGREKARAKFLRTFRDCGRKIRKAFADQGSDDPFLEFLMLQSVWMQFVKFPRGFPMLDDDMKPNVVGPVAEVLFAFDGIVKGNVLRDFEKALAECEAKIGKSVGDAVTTK